MSRRSMLLAASGTAAVAMPRVSVAQTVEWRIQSAWSARDLFHEFALDYARRVEALSGKRLKLDVQVGGSVVPPFQLAEAVHAGILDGGHGVAELRTNKNKANALFGAPPPFGWDSQGFLAWFYRGGGEALYGELLHDVMRLNLTGFLSYPMPSQAFGWFRGPIGGVGDLRGVRYRTFGLSAELAKALGMTVVMLPGAEVVPAMERGVLDGADSFNPSIDLALGLPSVAGHYLTTSHHRPVGAFEIIFNKPKFDALPQELRDVLREAALAASSDQLWQSYARFSKDFDEIAKRGVKITRTPADILAAQLKTWDAVIVEHSRDRFFAKVIASQKAWVGRTALLLRSDFDSGARDTAYRHFFG